jgi:hypothetical protein
MYIHYNILMNFHLCMIIIKIIYYIMLCLLVCFWIATANSGDLLCFFFNCYSCHVFCCSCIKLFSFYGLERIWCVTTLGTMTPSCLSLPHIYFWSLTSSLDFLFCSNPFPISLLILLSFIHSSWRSLWCSSLAIQNLLHFLFDFICLFLGLFCLFLYNPKVFLKHVFE